MGSRHIAKHTCRYPVTNTEHIKFGRFSFPRDWRGDQGWRDELPIAPPSPAEAQVIIQAAREALAMELAIRRCQFVAWEVAVEKQERDAEVIRAIVKMSEEE